MLRIRSWNLELEYQAVRE